MILVERLITENGVDTFLFGSRSEFNDFCRETVTQLRGKYPNIKRIYVRGEFPHINDDYKEHLLQYYEYTYYPEKIICAGKSVYVERNYEIIDNSDFAYFILMKVTNRQEKRIVKRIYWTINLKVERELHMNMTKRKECLNVYSQNAYKLKWNIKKDIIPGI